MRSRNELKIKFKALLEGEGLADTTVNFPDGTDIKLEDIIADAIIGEQHKKSLEILSVLLGCWSEMTADFKQVVNEQERKFYESMHHLVEAVEAGEFCVALELPSGMAPWVCSACNVRYLLSIAPSFCPKCGINHEKDDAAAEGR